MGEILKDKYMNSNRGDSQPVATSRDSLLWKAICREWDAINQNVSWNLGNGRQVLFWKDSWLEGYGPLINHLNSKV